MKEVGSEINILYPYSVKNFNILNVTAQTLDTKKYTGSATTFAFIGSW